jgi:hypothetical protein
MSYDEIVRHQKCPFRGGKTKYTVGKKHLSVHGGNVVSYVLLRQEGDEWTPIRECDWERTNLIRKAESEGRDISGYEDWSDDEWDDFVVKYLRDYTARRFGDEITNIHS